MSWWRNPDVFLIDLRYAFRRLRNQPGFAIVACLSLAVGIGSATAGFGVLYAVMVRDLPVRDPDRLAVVSMQYTGFQYSMSYPAYVHLRDRLTTLEGLIAFRAQTLNVKTGPATERITGMLVTGNYFDVLGVPMALGSAITPEDDRVPGTGGSRGLVAVVSHGYWVKRFNASPGAIGRSIRINGRPATIIGVAPPRFNGTRVGSLPDVYVPMMFVRVVFDRESALTNPRDNWLRIIARVKPDVSRPQAQAQMTTVFRQWNHDVVLPLATTDAARQRAQNGVILLASGASGLLELGNTVKPTLVGLMGLVGLILLIACANVASLVVARAERSQRETAIARALGATGGRLLVQNLIEGGTIAATAVALGVVLAVWMRGLLVQLLPAGRELDVTLDSNVFAATFFAGVSIALALGGLTAWQGARAGLVSALKGNDLAARLWVRKGLIVGQLALSLVVLLAAGLFVRTLHQLRQVDPGFERQQVLIASTDTSGYSPEQRKAFYTRLLADVRAIPGVVCAATSGEEPLAVNTGWNLWVRRGQSAPQLAGVSVSFISKDYFRTMGIGLLRGREFEEGDGIERVIVNENLVRAYLGSEDPIGYRITGNGNTSFEIIGVVKDSASIGLRDLDQHMMYVPGGEGVLHVRAAVPPATLTSAVEAAVHRLDADVPVFNVRTIEQQLERTLIREQTFARLSVAFALVALVLSAIGLYGVIANAVSRRTREMGIRLALGAEPWRVVRMIVKEAGVVIAIGIAIGAPSAFALGRTLQGLLFGVQPADAATAAIAIGALSAVAFASAWIPARRAARVDPLVALRSE
jgi:putative ABC transport system permease protein